MSRLYDCTEDSSAEIGITAAVDAVRAGQLVVLPTDTLYGLGCDAFNNQAVSTLLAAKHRGPDMPVPVLVGSWDTIQGLVQTYTPQTRSLVEAFWPGALSIVVHQAPSLPWNLGDTRGTVLLRMPLHPIAIELLRQTGPMAVSSANISGQPPASSVEQAQEQLGRSVEVFLDGGNSPIGEPSTIVDVSGERPRILREGAISTDRVAEVLHVEPESLR